MDRRARELAVSPVGNERSKRSEQPAGHREDLVQGGKRRPVVVAVHVVEPVTALTHVPLRDVLVEEEHHCLRRVRRFVTLEQTVCLCFHRREPRKNPAIEQCPLPQRGILLRW